MEGCSGPSDHFFFSLFCCFFSFMVSLAFFWFWALASDNEPTKSAAIARDTQAVGCADFIMGLLVLLCCCSLEISCRVIGWGGEKQAMRVDLTREGRLPRMHAFGPQNTHVSLI